jgi:hypothetical protein
MPHHTAWHTVDVWRWLLVILVGCATSHGARVLRIASEGCLGTCKIYEAEVY